MSFLSSFSMVLMRSLTSKDFGHVQMERIHKAATKPAPIAAAAALMWGVVLKNRNPPCQMSTCQQKIDPKYCSGSLLCVLSKSLFMSTYPKALLACLLVLQLRQPDIPLAPKGTGLVFVFARLLLFPPV